MIALSEHLRNHGYDPTVEKHTRIPGIWEKLKTLYALDIIDDRENSFEYEDTDKYLEFKLPEEDYDEPTFMKGKRRTESETPSSPPRLGRSPSPQGIKKRKRGDIMKNTRASTVDDTDEPRTSPAASPPAAKPTRTGRSTNRSMGRVKAESSSRHQSKDTAVETADEDEAAEETEEGVEDDEQEGEEEDGTLSPKAKSKAKADPPATRKSKRKR
jgi:MRG-binding protein